MAATRSEMQATSKKWLARSERFSVMACSPRVALMMQRKPKHRLRIVSDVGMMKTPRRRLERSAPGRFMLTLSPWSRDVMQRGDPRPAIGDQRTTENTKAPISRGLLIADRCSLHGRSLIRADAGR